MSDDRETVLACTTLMAGLIVTAYAFKNPISPENTVAMLRGVRDVLAEPFMDLPACVEPAVERPTAAQIKKSITDAGLISFIDGRSYKTLKRHLTGHGLDPRGYRERFGLPADYPMTAPSYSAARSALAKANGLGAGRGNAGLAAAA